MAKQPNIFIKNEVVRDAHHPVQGNPAQFKANVGGLIDAGYVVGVGEDAVEKVFDSSAKFSAWFDSVPATSP